MPLVFVAAEKLGGEPGSQAQKEKGRESWRAAAESRPCQGLPTVTGRWSASQGPPPPLLLPALPVWASLDTFSGLVFFFFSPWQCLSLAPFSSREDGDTETASHGLLLPSMRPEDQLSQRPSSRLQAFPHSANLSGPPYIPSSAPHREARALGKVGRSTVNTVKEKEGGPAIT